jgi:hypothetical protein
MRKASAALLALALAPWAPAGLACGHCIEDKIAAVYDHAVVTQALARKHQVAFFGLDGPLNGGDGERRLLERAAETAYGADRGSARVSIESASLSVAYDPEKVSYFGLQQFLHKKLARRGHTPLPLRMMDRLAELKTPARPAQ